MSLFRKPKKNVRNRGPLEAKESDEEHDNGIEEIHASINKLKDKKKAKKNKSKDQDKTEKKSSLLSFDDEHEEEDSVDFKVKKSSASRKLIKQREKGKKVGDIDFPEKDERSVDDNENQENIINGKVSRNDLGSKDIKVIDDDVEIVVKDNVIKKPADSWTLSGVEAEALHMEEEDFENEDKEESDEDSDPLQKIIEKGGIPDAAAIHAARKKREALRAKGGDDYIPIKKGETGKKKGGRLTREEDEEEDFSEERISFTRKELSKDEEYHKKLRKEEESEDSDPEWEKMQISKAITGQQMTSNIENQLNLDPMMPKAPPPPIFQHNIISKEVGGLSRPAKYDLPGIRERMRKRLEEMKEVSKRHAGDADRAVDDLVESQMEVDRLESEIPRHSEKYKYYQDLRGFMTDLTDCYDEKVGMVSYLEGRLCKLYSERRGKLVERRRQDVRDQADILAALSATNLALGLDPVQDAVRDFRVAEREGRRMRRRKAREEKGIQRTHKDGLSSDEEMPSKDEASLGKVKSDVKGQASQLMSDVVAQFSDMDRVGERLSAWREEDNESYQQAYVSICLPRIFAPLIRVEQLFWDPFKKKEGTVSEQGWYSSLATFSVSSSETFSMFEEDPDRNLVSACCEKVVLPKLVSLVRAKYDPLSSSQTERLVECVTKLTQDFPTITTRSKHLKELLDVVVESMGESLDNDVYLPMYTKHQMESPNSPHSQFFHRQFWSGLKLFRNLLAWAGIIADTILSGLALDRLLNRYLIMGLRADPNPLSGIEKAAHLVSALPSWWLVAGTPQLAKLTMLTKWVVGLGNTRGLAREGVLECARLLGILGDRDTGDKLRELL